MSISVDVFEQIYKSGAFNISGALIEKVKDIQQRIQNSSFTHPFTAQPVVHNQQHNNTNNRYVSIFGSKKKPFISMLNKLTINNVDSILKKLKDSIQEPYDDEIKTAIKFIKSDRKNIDLYIKILELFPIEKVKQCIQEHLNANMSYWTLPDEFCGENMYSTSVDYDLYCKFIKWKDETLALTSICIIYKINIPELAEIIYDTVYKYIDTNKQNYQRQILDPPLEHIELLWESYSIEQIDKLLSCRNSDIPSSSRFKLMDIKEKMMTLCIRTPSQ